MENHASHPNPEMGPMARRASALSPGVPATLDPWTLASLYQARFLLRNTGTIPFSKEREEESP